MRGIFTYCLLFLFAGFFAYQESFAQNSQIDSLKLRLENTISIDEKYVDVLNDLSFEYLKVDPSIGLDMINRSLYLADSLQYKKGLFRATLNKGNGFWVSGLFDQALKYYLTALSISDSTDRTGLTKLFNNIGEVYRKQSQFDSAFINYNRAFRLAKMNLREGKTSYISMISSNIAETHFMTSQIDSAAYYYNLTYEYSLKEGSPRGMSYALFGLGEIERINNNLAEAIKKHEKSLSIRREIDDKRAIIQSLIKLSDCYYAASHTEGAMKLLKEAEALASDIQAYDLLSEAYFKISDLYRKSGRYLLANNYLNDYLELNDSLEAQSVVDRINNLKSSLESELREAENLLLKEEKKQQAQYLTYQIIVIITITLIILILSGFLFQYYKRLKQQRSSNQELDRLNQIILNKNREIEEINKNLDHRLISTSRMLQESQKVAKLGGWEYFVNTEEMKWTDEVYSLLELEPGSVKPTIRFLQNFIEKEDYQELKDSINRLPEEKKEQLVRANLVTANGNKKVISIKLIPQVENDQIQRVFGTVMDISERISNEQKQREILQTLLELSKSTNLKETSFKEFIEDLLFKASNTINVSRVSFWIYNESSSSISCFRAYKGGRFLKEKHIHYLRDLPIYFDALDKNRTIAASDAYTDPRTIEFTRGYLQQYDIRSLLDAKVQLEGKFLGIISFEKINEPRDWSFSDQRFAGSLADIISTAFSSYENKKLVIEKENLIDKLVHKNQNLREFAYVISHNLREPVAQIMGLTDLLNEDELDDETKDEVIRRINEVTLKLDMVIKDLSIVLSSQEGKDKRFRRVKLKEIVEKTKWVFTEEIEKIKPLIELDFNKSLELEGPLDYFSNMIYNLFSNSIKYRKNDEQLKIRVHAVKNEHSIELHFSDNGIGFDAETYKDKIFKMYQRFHVDIEGRGIGLYIVKKQIEQLGGQITVSSKPFEGTEFKILLPIKNSKVIEEVQA